jgi:Flp pilus assembly protein TadG
MIYRSRSRATFSRPRSRASSRGQGLVEFALTVPVLLLILLISIDAGRLFYGYVALQNAARIAANFAATHADSWPGGPNPDQVTYAAQIQRDTTNLSCGSPVPPPTFSPSGIPPRGPGDGHVATVSLTCTFHPLTPIIGAIVGNNLPLTATEAFPIRSGLLDGIPITAVVPTTTTTTTTSSTTTTTTSTTTSTTTTTTTTTLQPGDCRVPTMMNTPVDDATTAWLDAGFKGNKLNVAVGPPNYLIRKESIGNTVSIWDGSAQNCNTFSLNVGPTP